MTSDCDGFCLLLDQPHEAERRQALEGDRWSDLIRTGDAVAVLGIEPFQTLFPIPQSELDLAPNLEQNPGY